MSRRFRAGPFRTRHLVLGLALLLLFAVLSSGCDVDVPQNTFDTKGEPAGDQERIFVLALWPAIVVGIAVMVGLGVIMLRFRERKGDERPPRQLHGNTRLEIAWTVAPTLLLLGLALPMIVIIFDTGRSPAADAFPVTVTGFQWAWQFEYPEIIGQDGKPVTTLGEVHIPVGREVAVTVESRDVVHSFWVPKLAGKVDAIPGRQNVIWIRADEPGSLSGQCAEFCGLGHAEMKIVLHADGPEDFRAWVNEVTSAGGAQPSPTASPGGGG